MATSARCGSWPKYRCCDIFLARLSPVFGGFSRRISSVRPQFHPFQASVSLNLKMWSNLRHISLPEFRNIHTATCLLAGHSKWANIRHTKGAKDLERSMLFASYSRKMRLAIQDGGSANPQLNSQLKSLIEIALRKKMPNSTIQNVLKKYGDSKSAKMTKYFLDLKILNKVYIVTVLTTDNVPGARQAVSTVMKKFGGSYTDARPLFEERGVIDVQIPEKLQSLNESALEEALTEHAIECNAEEVEITDLENKIVSFFCNPVEIERVKRELEQRGFEVDNAEHIFLPKTAVTLSEKELERLEVFRSKMKEIEGVDGVFDNVEVPES